MLTLISKKENKLFLCFYIIKNCGIILVMKKSHLTEQHVI